MDNEAEERLHFERLKELRSKRRTLQVIAFLVDLTVVRVCEDTSPFNIMFAGFDEWKRQTFSVLVEILAILFQI